MKVAGGGKVYLHNRNALVNHRLMNIIKTPQDLASALTVLISQERRFDRLLKSYGQPSLRLVPATLESLLSIVTGQFLSLSSSAAIWGTVRAHLGPVTADSILACSPEALVALGLSRAKAKCFHGVANAWKANEINLDAEAGRLRKQLLNVWGIGPWTADVFLLTASGHGDAWPGGDVALQHAMHHFLDLPTRPSTREMELLSAPWRPHRGAASRLLWAHYRAITGKCQTPSQK